MHSQSRASTTSAQFVPRFSKWVLKPLAGVLKTGDPAATVDRFFKSKHVRDLQLIVALGFAALAFVLVFGYIFSYESVLHGASSDPHAAHWRFRHVFFIATTNFLTFFGPVLAVFGAVFAWAYQTGSARLGVVDLFACEITTLCRVAVVVDTVRRFVTAFDQGPPAAPAGVGQQTVPAHPYTAQEDYFPVFGSSTRDLETLEARVVINITAFYTYMKAVRDSARALAEMGPQPAETDPLSNTAAADRWHEAARNVVYMLFLGMESARHAVADLVEYEPENAECTIVILISELEAFRFLASQYRDQDEVHHKRIILRIPEYQHLLPKLCSMVEHGRKSEKAHEHGKILRESHQPSQWEPAIQLLPELNKRYVAAMVSIHP